MAEKSCQTPLQKDAQEARDDDEMQKIVFEASRSDYFWPPSYWDLRFPVFLVETCFQVP